MRSPTKSAFLARRRGDCTETAWVLLSAKLAHNMWKPARYVMVLLLAVCGRASCESQLEELLIMATVQHDAAAVKEIIEAGVSANTVGEKGVTVLMMACMMGHADVAKELLQGGASVEAADKLGNRPLMLAASYKNRVELVRMLLQAGAKVNAQNTNGLTALMRAIVEGQPQAVRVLLEEGNAALNPADGEGNQALMLAALKGDPDSTRLLLLAGASTEAKNRNGLTPLMVAASVVHNDDDAGVAHLAVVDLLLVAKAKMEAIDSHGATALIIAAAAGNVRLVRKLLERGAKADAFDYQGVTALEAALKGDLPQHQESAELIRDTLHGRGPGSGRKEEL